MKPVRGHLAIVVLLLHVTEPAAAAASGTMEIRLGESIQRTWEDAAKADLAYGPKQAFDPATKETRIWLPYGARGVYYETAGLSMTDPGPSGTGCPLAVTRDGSTSGRLVFKLRFDRPIGAFRLSIGWSEWGVGGGTVGGVEYSTDGMTWKGLRELGAPGIVEPLLDDGKTEVEGLHARELYIRCYSRSRDDPAGDHGSGRWMKLRMAGDPAWGDRATTFFGNQMQLRVTASGRLGDAGDSADRNAVAPEKPRTDSPALGNAGPWGIASGAEWSGDHPIFNPLLRDAGVRWLRLFPEWGTIQPRRDAWNWAPADRLVEDARGSGIQIAGVFAYFAPWASADGGTRRCPVKDMAYWRDYVAAAVARYRNDIRHWEVWNEFNGSFAVDGTPRIYAEMTREAYLAARRIDPAVEIGIGCANFDVGWLDAVIKAGTAGHFDHICVHPYENLGAVMEGGGEPGFLAMAGSLRRMLAANGQRPDIPLWITEIGYQAPIEPDPTGDALQAEALVKAYILALAGGFERIFWFEARGPAYGRGTDHGIIRKDWTPRPAHEALKRLSGTLGPDPRFVGPLTLGDGGSGYGFVFEDGARAILVAWAPGDKAGSLRFDGAVRVLGLAGAETPLPAGRSLALTRAPVFVFDLPRALADAARAGAGKPFPWGSEYGQAREVSCRLGATNDERGIRQTRPETTAVGNGLSESWRRTDFSIGGEGRYVYFRVDSTFASFGTNDLEITVMARRIAADKPAGTGLLYESLKGYRRAPGYFEIPAKEGWHEHTWKVDDANFVGEWGWNFRTEATGSPNEFLIKEVRVRKP